MDYYLKFTIDDQVEVKMKGREHSYDVRVDTLSWAINLSDNNLLGKIVKELKI